VAFVGPSLDGPSACTAGRAFGFPRNHVAPDGFRGTRICLSHVCSSPARNGDLPSPFENPPFRVPHPERFL
jgi:hypothetical protein